MAMHEGKAIEILLVEDNPADVRLTLETLKDCKIRNNISVVGDGEEAMKYLRREGEYAKAPRPDLMLLDLRLPKKSGLEVLAEMKDDEKLRSIPTVILTSSGDETDIATAYSKHASCYIQKPLNLNEFTKVVRAIEEFWLTIVKFPPR